MSAERIDMLADYLKITDYCLDRDDMAGVSMAALILMKQQLGLRRNEICGLRIKDIRFPAQLGGQDSTSYILVDLYKSKTDTEEKGVRLCLWENTSTHPLAPRYCAKRHLEFWLAMHPNIHDPNAAVFPHFNEDGKTFSRHMTKEECSEVFERCCRGAGLIDDNGKVKYTTHSTRHSFAWHGGICGADFLKVKLAGRWISDCSFVVYFQSGSSDAQILVQDGQPNLLIEIWPWRDTHPCSLHGIGEGQLLSVGQNRNRNAKK